jgi:Ala-tRNA(Pro) deacylase
MAATALIEALDRHRTAYQLIPHPRTDTAVAEARVLGVPTDETAKTVIVRTPEGFVRAVVPASRRVDLRRVRDVLGVADVGLASELELAGAYPWFELGAVPPFDRAHEDGVIIDRHLCEHEHVVFEAGTHDESIRMRTRDLIDVSDARLAEICAE